MSGRIEWRCAHCREPIDDGEGFVAVDLNAVYENRQATKAWDRDHPEPRQQMAEFLKLPAQVRWAVLHTGCDPNVERDAYDDYWIAIELLRTPLALLHLTTQAPIWGWGDATNWAGLVGGAMARLRSQEAGPTRRRP